MTDKIVLLTDIAHATDIELMEHIEWMKLDVIELMNRVEKITRDHCKDYNLIRDLNIQLLNGIKHFVR